MERKELIAELKKLNIKYVNIRYSGSGDSGQIDDVDAFGKFSKKPRNLQEVSDTYTRGADNVIVIPPVLGIAVQEIGNEIIESKYGGFENNDGGSGVVTLDVDNDKINHIHNEYYTESNTTNYEENFASKDGGEDANDEPVCTCKNVSKGHKKNCPYWKKQNEIDEAVKGFGDDEDKE